jgi:hypothetical protein
VAVLETSGGSISKNVPEDPLLTPDPSGVVSGGRFWKRYLSYG